MNEVHWGKIAITLLLPLLASVWMMFVIRRKSALQPVTSKYSVATMLLFWVVGFVVCVFFSIYFGAYILAQLKTGQPVTPTLQAQGNFVSKIALYISGLWGALFPYRLLAREGKRQIWIWLVSALAYAILFFIFTFMVR